MKILSSLLLLFLTKSVLFASDTKEAIPFISFGTFPLSPVRTYVSASPGTPSGKADMDSPDPNDYPPAIAVSFEDIRPYTIDKPGTYSFPSMNVLRVYCITDAKTAPYRTIQRHIAALQKILKSRPKSVPYNRKEYSPLPDYPHSDAAHAFELHIAYVDADWGSGICYMTLFTQDGSNHASNDELDYLFQGLSKDGAYYMSADFRISHRKLEKWQCPDPDKGDYTPDIKLLTPLNEDSFVPSLPKIRKWLESLRIEHPTE